jgi:hypothetical protein
MPSKCCLRADGINLLRPLRFAALVVHTPCVCELLWLQVAPCPDEWARSAMSALIRVGEPLDAITAREAATGTICRYLCILPPTDVPAVAKTIIHWIAQRTSGSSRVSNLLLLWRAVVDTDLTVWKRAQAGADLRTYG